MAAKGALAAVGPTLGTSGAVRTSPWTPASSCWLDSSQLATLARCGCCRAPSDYRRCLPPLPLAAATAQVIAC